MLLKEFPVLPENPHDHYRELWPDIPRRLYKTLEMLCQCRIPNNEYSMNDLEKLMKSLIARQSPPGKFIAVGGNWSLMDNDIGVDSDVRVDLVFFPTYMVVSLMTLFWHRYPERAKRLKGFQKALHEGLNFASMRRLYGHGLERHDQRLQALRILKMGDVFRYVVNHADEHEGCHALLDVLVECRKEIDEDYYHVPKEVRLLQKSLAILPNKTPWKTTDYFTWRSASNHDSNFIVIVEAPYATPPKAEVQTDTVAHELAMTRGSACILGRYSKKHYRHTTFRDRADSYILSEYRNAINDILRDASAIDSSGKATKRILHLVIRGLADHRGTDFEISTRNDSSCNVRLSMCFMDAFENILERFSEPWRYLTAQKNRLFGGGSPFIEVNRNGEPGDDDFTGFGENYNAIEIRVSRGIRNSYLDRFIDMIGELIDVCRHKCAY